VVEFCFGCATAAGNRSENQKEGPLALFRLPLASFFNFADSARKQIENFSGLTKKCARAKFEPFVAVWRQI
jgi:hypothetical protein